MIALPTAHQILRSILAFVLLIVTAMLLAMTLKTNNLTEPLAITHSTEVGGPFEASNTTSRFALTEVLVEEGRFDFSLEKARFAVPDVVFLNGRFITSFMPGISFVAAMFYWLGKPLGAPILASFATNILFALLNGVLIFKLAKKFNASSPAALLAAGSFLFATNALAYASTLTQHHGSTSMILLALMNVLQPRSWWRNLLFGAYCGIAFLFDFPNLFFLFPLGLYLLTQHISITEVSKKYQVSFKLSVVCVAISLLAFVGVSTWYNSHTSGSPTVLAQFSNRTNVFDSPEKKAQDQLAQQNIDPYDMRLPFSTRLQVQGATVLLFSQQRSWFWYSPIVLLGALGLIHLWRKEKTAAILMMSVIATNIVIYISFGDPWGGWSFGPRYLIPSAALLSVSLGVALSAWRRNVVFIPIFTLVFAYSLWISTAGALTTANIPPKQEAIHLLTPIPFTSEYNFQKLKENRSQSLIYRLWFDESMTSEQYHRLYVGLIATLAFSLLATNAWLRKEETL